MSSKNTRNRTVLYLRVSTADQKPDLQYDGLRRYAERAELTIVGEYLDTAVSGRKQGRPQLDAMMKAARNYECDGRNQSSAPLVQATRRSRVDGGWMGMFA